MSKIATLEITASEAVELIDAMALAMCADEQDRDTFDEFSDKLRETFGLEAEG